ncbi:MAG: putative membrane protein, partial [Methylophagaceae bacterium]
MISILPNWHPIFVHFSIGLLGIAVFFYFASALLAKEHH